MAKRPSYAELEHQVKGLKPGHHLCCIYETEREHQVLITAFMRLGLERHEKVVYIVDTRTGEEVLNYLFDDGLRPEPYLKSGQLVILTVDEAYMRNAVFDPDSMLPCYMKRPSGPWIRDIRR